MLNIQLIYNLAIPYLGVYPREKEMHEVLCTNVYNGFNYKSPKLKITHMPISRWMDKYPMVYPYNGILLDSEKEWAMYRCANKDES